MTNSSHLNTIRVLTFTAAALVLAANSAAQERPPVAEQMAKTYGLDSFGQIEGIRYTFNAEFPGAKVARTWEWEPKTNQVSYEGKNKDGKPVKVTYQRSQLGNQSDAVKNEVDPAFMNDQYWLLLPLHVAWDGADLTDAGTQKLPLGNGSATRIVASSEIGISKPSALAVFRLMTSSGDEEAVGGAAPASEH